MSDTSRPGTMRALRVTAGGGLEEVRLPVPQPAEGEVLIRVGRSGVNFHDLGLSAATRLPGGTVPGLEVAGVREDDGARVVALCGKGGYAEWVTAPAGAVFPIPDALDDHRALAVFVSGLTAWHLLHTMARVGPNETVVVHSGAGSVGIMAVQLAASAGATVIATASTEDKRQLVRKMGASAALDGAPEGLTERLRDAADGRPIDVILERDGGAVFQASLAALGPLGRMVVYGTASGSCNVSTGALIPGSHSIAGFFLNSVLTPGYQPRQRLAELSSAVLDGRLRAQLGPVYALSDVAVAHAELADRRSVGKLVLDPTR
jgi:NADPH:quinone reductase